MQVKRKNHFLQNHNMYSKPYFYSKLQLTNNSCSGKLYNYLKYICFYKKKKKSNKNIINNKKKRIAKFYVSLELAPNWIEIQ